MLIKLAAILNLMFIISVLGQMHEGLWNATNAKDYGKSEILSRRKRFLIFPEGSSVQLVLCNTFPNINEIGDIILWGYTAALAFELPQDPYSPFRHHADPLHRRADIKEIYYLNEDGRIIYKRPYHRKFIVNPAFAKRSIDEVTKNEDKNMDRKEMHGSYKRQLLNSKLLDKRIVEFHRTSRSLLYRKLDIMLQGLGENGKQCVLKTLCLVGQSQHHPQGSFFEEILRATFTLPQGRSEDIDDEGYDIAVSTTESCDVLYPDCNAPLQEPGLGSKTK